MKKLLAGVLLLCVAWVDAHAACGYNGFQSGISLDPGPYDATCNYAVVITPLVLRCDRFGCVHTEGRDHAYIIKKTAAALSPNPYGDGRGCFYYSVSNWYLPKEWWTIFPPDIPQFGYVLADRAIELNATRKTLSRTGIVYQSCWIRDGLRIPGTSYGASHYYGIFTN